MRSPTIGITGPAGWHHLAWRCTRFALRRAGAKAVRLMPSHTGHLHHLDAVVIGGGDDIDPGLYFGVDDGRASYDRERDAFEKRVIHDALRRNRPLLGICRGAQLLNAVLGGNLHQDIRHMRAPASNHRTILPRKLISIARASRLAAILGVSTVRVNSLHHQAVDRPGGGLRVVATDRDGIVQAIEGDEGVFRIGVQWHPEYLPYRAEQRRLFEALVEAARGS